MPLSRRWVLNSLLACLPAALQAQNGAISGLVRWRGQPLANAPIGLYLLDREQKNYIRQWATATGPSGTFSVRSLPAGVYVVIVRYQGKIMYQNKVSLSSLEQKLEIELK